MATFVTSSANVTRSHRHHYGHSKSVRQNEHLSISRLREAIDKLDSKVAALMLQRHELESFLELAVHSQSPVHRIPAEILAGIFEMGVLELDDNAPLMVSTILLVCRFWRDVAINTPTLWTKIAVTPHDSWTQARLRLERSKASSLDVFFSFDARAAPLAQVMDNMVHAMDLIRPALWRVRTFHLHVPSRAQAQVILSRCREPAPRLQDLSIRFEHSLQDYRSSPQHPLFGGSTPSLRSCSFSSFDFGWDLSFVSNLRVLKLGGYISGAPCPTTVWEILRNCPQLEELALKNISAYDGGMFFPKDEIAPPPASKVLHLSRLRKVSFYFSGVILTQHIMDHTVLPALESLELYYLENVTPILSRLYEQALTCLPLRHLRIESCIFNELQFANLLRKTPSLTSLELIDIDDVSSALLKSLSSTSPIACPRLARLTLDQCTSFTWDSLRTFVETRFFMAGRNGHSAARGSSCASTAAAMHAWQQSRSSLTSSSIAPPCRLDFIDVTRCNQIGKEMTQWLRMYIPHVVCQPGKALWS